MKIPIKVADPASAGSDGPRPGIAANDRPGLEREDETLRAARPVIDDQSDQRERALVTAAGRGMVLATAARCRSGVRRSR